MAKISDFEGIGPAFAEKLAAAGVRSVEGLLTAGASKKGRQTLAESTGIREAQILSWVNMADLFRIKGVSSQFAELLNAAGIDSIKELRNRKPENLHAKMKEVNDEKSLVRQIPSGNQVAAFVEQAKALEPMITH